MSEASTPALDRAHLAAMTGEDEALAIEVLGLFKEQAAMWSRLLDPKRTAQTWADAAHSLKGSALGVGAMRLADACAEAETLGRSGSATPVQAALAIDAVRTEMVTALEEAAKTAHALEAIGGFKASNASNS
ncbi:MAG: Hpt domain-containing protein [Pseudomonadota bacterium]